MGFQFLNHKVRDPVESKASTDNPYIHILATQDLRPYVPKHMEPNESTSPPIRILTRRVLKGF